MRRRTLSTPTRDTDPLRRASVCVEGGLSSAHLDLPPLLIHRLVAFIQEPLGPGSADEARCPLCRLPACVLERGPAGLDRDVRRAIERDHPGWRSEQGRCARCAEVYEALLPTPG